MSRHTRTTSSLLVALVASVFAFKGNAAQAVTYTVGTGGECTHSTIASAAAAAEGSPGPDTIRVSFAIPGVPTAAYTSQAIALTASQELDIVGGFANCSPGATRTGRVILDGDGGATEPVFRITVPTGGLVRMSYLTIRKGDEDGSGRGGGIYFKGNGILELSHLAITQSIAGYGGGIYAEGTGSVTQLVIGEDVAIVDNTARYNGGGVVNDGTKMTMTQPDSYIANNQAQGVFIPFPISAWSGGYGGGLLVWSGSRPAYTHLGSTGFGNAGAIYINDARQGGGVAVLGNDNIAQLELFSTDPARPMRIKGNSASVDGGGVYLGRSDSEPGRVRLFAWFAYIEDNVAPTGAAVAVRGNSGGTGGVYFNDPANRPSGAINCPVDKPCGSISANAALDNTSQPTGGIVEVDPFGFTRFYRMTFEGNSGESVFRGNGGGGGHGFETHHVAITGNSTSNYLIAAGDGGKISLQDTTIGGNVIGATTVLRFGNSYAGASQLLRSIIWQPGKTTLQLTSGPPLDLVDDMVSERASLDGGTSPYVVQQDPRFVDPANGDYSLRAGSPALDYTPSVANDANDLYSQPRDIDLPIVENFRGRRDLGAIERQALQPLVLNMNFDADLRLWNTATAGVTTWDNTANVSGTAGSGSAHIRLPTAVTGTRTGGVVQCVHLPGPGIYSLNGSGRGTGTTITPGDLAELYWEFRRVGGENCTNGAANATGTKTLSNGNSWRRPATPTYITVTEQEWTFTSSIAVTLVAVESGPAGAPTNAWFDGITLGVGGDDTIFASGFDSL